MCSWLLDLSERGNTGTGTPAATPVKKKKIPLTRLHTCFVIILVTNNAEGSLLRRVTTVKKRKGHWGGMGVIIGQGCGGQNRVGIGKRWHEEVTGG
jgi:hypothetical protein